MRCSKTTSHAILEHLYQLTRRQSQPRLAAPARAGERQQAGLLQQPPYEARELKRQVVGRARIPIPAGYGGQPAATVPSYFTGGMRRFGHWVCSQRYFVLVGEL
jgi:hypothetical protein